MSNIGILEFAEGRYNEAKQLLEEALDIRKKQQGWGRGRAKLPAAASAVPDAKTASPAKEDESFVEVMDLPTYLPAF